MFKLHTIFALLTWGWGHVWLFFHASIRHFTQQQPILKSEMDWAHFCSQEDELC